MTNRWNCDHDVVSSGFIFITLWSKCDENVRQWKKWSFGRTHFGHNFVTMSRKEKFIENDFVMKSWPDTKSIFHIMVVFFYFTLLWKCDENVMSLFMYSFFGSRHLKFPASEKSWWAFTTMINDHWTLIHLFSAKGCPSFLTKIQEFKIM